jgi:tRNA-binding protein
MPKPSGQGSASPTEPSSTVHGAVPIKPEISVAELDRVDIRVGTIRAAEEVSGSQKLVRLRVDFGNHSRVILSGMKSDRADLSELVGRQALFVVNLPPRKMAGEVSEGMILDIGYPDGLVPALAVPERPVPDGSRAG